MFVHYFNSSSDILAAAYQNMQTVIGATQKETAIDQQQHSCETLICHLYQTILRPLSIAAMLSTRGEFANLIVQPRRVLLPIITTEKVLDKYSISHNFIVQRR
jgi:hypothetical protein